MDLGSGASPADGVDGNQSRTGEYSGPLPDEAAPFMLVVFALIYLVPCICLGRWVSFYFHGTSHLVKARLPEALFITVYVGALYAAIFCEFTQTEHAELAFPASSGSRVTVVLLSTLAFGSCWVGFAFGRRSYMLSAGQVVMDFIRRLQSCLTHSWKALGTEAGRLTTGVSMAPLGTVGAMGVTCSGSRGYASLGCGDPDPLLELLVLEVSATPL
eukprot:CAMPEP_0176321132 /NCGR_PEP_ID=MMETSP0121_2-20121125/71188_1 /TAXON_ID=160619 /ORGANISM="Kryptoperidinium foliaceum, Strain CCMP 1326" /LENGTH=214 /DNA_ID=CAMNT_0017663559 /DNA_START=40 /DNA_END=682 /DNA_ORIENTATION=-